MDLRGNDLPVAGQIRRVTRVILERGTMKLPVGLLAAGLIALLMVAGLHRPAAACGPDSDCTVGSRTYRIWVPEGDGPFGAVIFMHGYRSSAAAVMSNADLRDMAQDLRVALIAPKSGGDGWLIANRPRSGFVSDHRETAFFDALLDDVTARFPVDRKRLLATGFSSGGMMTWTLACRMPERFAAFLPISGTFWAPVPQDCKRQRLDLVHVHGMSDTVVPLTGRAIADTRQGDVNKAFKAFRAPSLEEPRAMPGPPDLACRGAPGGENHLVLCRHDGGHIMRAEWIAWAWRNTIAHGTNAGRATARARPPSVETE